MNQADAFRLLMQARWGRLAPVQLASTLEAWGLTQAEINYISPQALRVADLLLCEIELQANLRLLLTFPDGSTAVCNIAGTRFYSA